MVRTRFALILYFRMVTHKAACHTLSKAFLKSVKTWCRFCWCWRYFSHRILRLKICSVVLLPALNPACSSAINQKSWSLPMSAPGKLLVLWMLTPDRKRFSPRCNQSDCGVSHLGCAMSIFWMVCEGQGCLSVLGC